MLWSVLEILGVSLVAGFVWFIWPPLVLAVLGVACLWASYARSRSARTGAAE